MRIYSLGLLLAIAGCGEQAKTVVAEAKAEDRVLCAIGDAQLVDDCAIERSAETLTVRHADGSFRRFERQADGSLATADGADQLMATRMGDGTTEAKVGDAHYRFTL